MRFDAALLIPVARWANESHKAFRPNGFGRQYGFLDAEKSPAEVWRCDASQVRHWCTPVVGQKPRIVLSFGFMI